MEDRLDDQRIHEPESQAEQPNLIAPSYSWDVDMSEVDQERSSFPHSVKDWYAMDINRDGKPDYIVNGAEAESDERLANEVVNALFSRVRVVGHSSTAPESVRHSVHKLKKRKSFAPSWPFSFHASADSKLVRRWQDALSERSNAPASIDEATRLLVRDDGLAVGPNAHIRVPDFVDASLATGMAAMGSGSSSAGATPIQEPFSLFMPPPFRIIFLIALGLLCWSANLRGLRRLGLDAEAMMTSESKVRVLPHHRDHGEQLLRSAAGVNAVATSSTSARHLVGTADSEIAVFFRHPGTQETVAFHLGLMCLLWGAICWIWYRIYAFKTIFFGGDQLNGISNARGRHAQAIQGIAVLGVVAVAFWPGDVLHRPMRKSFGRHLLTILKPSLLQRIQFADIVLADILTSYARVFGELWLTMCFLWPKSDTPAWWNGKGSIAVPLLVSLPYLIRFRQCISEFNTSTPSQADGKRHMKPLFNAAKYASAFPVIWLSVLQSNNLMGDSGFVRANVFFYTWVLSVFVNSLFSFWWDVTHDWGLEMLRWETWANTPSLVMHGVRSIHRRDVSSVPDYMTARDSARDANGDSYADAHGDARTSVLSGQNAVHGRHATSNSLHPTMTTSSTASATSGSTSSHARKESHFLRASDYEMLFPPIAYQLAMTSDLILRFAWSLKLSSHLHHIIELESTAFYLEALEILRRWGWTYLRIEWEACKRRMWEAEGTMESLTLASLRQDLRANGGSGANGGDAQHRD